MRSARALTLGWFALFPALSIPAIRAQEVPRFEVASVKPSNAGNGNSGSTTGKAQYRMTNASLASVIETAYGIPAYRLKGPGWLGAVRFDIDARFPEGTPPARVNKMLQTLLAERFQLVSHWETKTMAGYGLMLAKGGLKMKPVEPGPQGMGIGTGLIGVTRQSMQAFAETLSGRLSQPIQDLTGAKGLFTFRLQWTPDSPPRMESEKAAASPADPGPSVFTALQEQLGLKLEPRKVDVQVLVVDSISRTPTEN